MEEDMARKASLSPLPAETAWIRDERESYV
jgi:hypothetical protein